MLQIFSTFNESEGVPSLKAFVCERSRFGSKPPVLISKGLQKQPSQDCCWYDMLGLSSTKATLNCLHSFSAAINTHLKI